VHVNVVLVRQVACVYEVYVRNKLDQTMQCNGWNSFIFVRFWNLCLKTGFSWFTTVFRGTCYLKLGHDCSLLHPFCFIFNTTMSWDSSVDIATGCTLDDWMIGVQFPVGAGNFSLPPHIQTGSGAHPASYPVDTRGCFPGGKVARPWSCISAPPVHLHVMALSEAQGQLYLYLYTITLPFGNI
jgi:hypothetical protein